MGRFHVKEFEVAKVSDQIKEGKPVDIHVCDENFEWKLVKAILSDKEIEGGEPVNMVTEMKGTITDAMYMKILEEYREVPVPRSYRPWEKESEVVCWGLRFEEKKK
jgi:hypothetical protein